MKIRDLTRELGQRRVFRAAVIYAAFVWVMLQAADVFAGEGIIPEQWVRWLILAAALGLPVVLAGSWFLESPWRQRGHVALAGDLFVLLAIAGGAGLFVWQQWFKVGPGIEIAVGGIEATDLQPETEALAGHLEERLGLLLDAEPEAELQFFGTLSRGGDTLRLTVTLVGPIGSVRWSETFEEALVDQAQLQSGVVTAIGDELPAFAAQRDSALAIIDACPYPSSADSVLALAGGLEPEMLAPHIEKNSQNGLIYVQQAIGWFDASQTAPAPQRPVLFALAIQSLDQAALVCPRFAHIEELRMAYTGAAKSAGQRSQ